MVISIRQYGIRKYHSAESAAPNVVDTIINHMDNGNSPILVLLLFVIYMNDLPNASRLFKCIIYADEFK